MGLRAEFYHSKPSAITKTIQFQEFVKSLCQLNDDHRRMGYLQAHLKHVKHELTMYSWIADEKVAFFAIPSFAAVAREFGFITYDGSLIMALTRRTRVERSRGRRQLLFSRLRPNPCIGEDNNLWVLIARRNCTQITN